MWDPYSVHLISPVPNIRSTWYLVHGEQIFSESINIVIAVTVDEV